MNKKKGLALIAALAAVLIAAVTLAVIFADNFAVVFVCVLVAVGAVTFIAATRNEMKKYESEHKSDGESRNRE